MHESYLDISSPTGTIAAVLHRPAPGVRVGEPVLMTPAGLRDRTGPSRLYVRLARRLAARGHTVLRYDTAGVGESEGELPSRDKVTCYAAMQRGDRAGEVVCAARALIHAAGRPRVAVVGLSSGVFHAAQLARRAPTIVAGVFGISAPTLVHEVLLAETERAIHPDEGSFTWQRHIAHLYLKRATDPDAWRRLWRGESDYAAIGRALRALVPRVPSLAELDALASAALARLGRPAPTTPEKLAQRALIRLASLEPTIDRLTWEALLQLRGRKVPVELVFGALDGSRAVFDDFLRRPIPELDQLFTRHIIEDTSHDCASARAFDELASLLERFLGSLRAPREGQARELGRTRPAHPRAVTADLGS